MEKSGTRYSYDGARIGQGRDKVLAHLDEHPAIQQQLRDQLRRYLDAGGGPPFGGCPLCEEETRAARSSSGSSQRRSPRGKA